MSRNSYKRSGKTTVISAGQEITDGELTACATMHGIPSFLLRLARKHGVKIAVTDPLLRHRRD